MQFLEWGKSKNKKSKQQNPTRTTITTTKPKIILKEKKTIHEHKRMQYFLVAKKEGKVLKYSNHSVFNIPS